MSRQFDLLDAPPSLQAFCTLLILPSLSSCITDVFRGMPGVWKPHYRLLLGWLMQHAQTTEANRRCFATCSERSPPSWVEHVMVEGHAASGVKANSNPVKPLGSLGAIDPHVAQPFDTVGNLLRQLIAP